ncbi:unnamed protein product [Urochloa decumbens]|uniref:Neprosin PEP catalytic domain-containing protein n=1 Tax=Urochloa decumbens TaxID=240449 RepID=A0ABC9C3B6_9POAL
MLQHTADSSRKKKRRRKQLPSASRSAAAADAAQQGGGQCCCKCKEDKQLMSSLLALALLLLMFVVPPRMAAVAEAASSVSARRMARIQSHLQRINKPAVRSIRSVDGDTIDCVAAQEQHGLDHPLLKEHDIQTEPPEVPASSSSSSSRGGGLLRVPAAAADAEAVADSKSSNSSNRRGVGAWQTWHHGGHCPSGTVAIRRTTAEDLLRATSVARFGRKKKSKRWYDASSPPRAANAPDVISGNGHEHAIAYTAPSSQQQPVYGAKATINVWDPVIQESNGFSLSQLWILSGSFNGSDLNSIEAGWQVSPELYGDSRPRLFTYWTSDAYEATGCYNALCPGFVQTSSRIAIGASISPVSSAGGAQYDMTVLVWKDPKLGNWWLSYGGQLVGYWPAQLFTHLSDHATMVEWGGEVVDTRPAGVHTATQMGSGRFAAEGFGRASYFRNLETVDADNSLAQVPIDAIQTLAENGACYDIRKAYDGDDDHSGSGGWGTHFYYGGPGHNPACP